MPVKDKILDFWERKLKLEARMVEVESIKKEITPFIRCRCNSPGTMFRTKMTEREQDLLREYHSVCAFLETAEWEEDDE